MKNNYVKAFSAMLGLLVLLLLILTTHTVHAETFSFPSAWRMINDVSPAQESARLQTAALSESEKIASHHWIPRLYLDARSYHTNDPGDSFFGLLEQRAVESRDFDPASLNDPDAELYTRGALGVDLPLYEGGMKTSQVNMLKHSVVAQQNTTSQVQLEQYSQAGLAYGSIVVLDQQREKIRSLAAEIDRMMKGYQLGSRANPVGYSGLLGMRSLANRLNGLIGQYEAQRNSHYATLNEMGLKEITWSPEMIDADTFVSRYLAPSSPQADSSSVSYKVAAAQEGAVASEQSAKMEKAKFLPRVGAFAEGFVFGGKRDIANGYKAGVYLQWSLFNPSDYGSLKESRLKARAAIKSAEALAQQERAERTAFDESLKTLKANIALLNESYQTLIEQSKITRTLFQNGSINALQIVEVLSRRADLIEQQAGAELNLIRAASQAITKEKFDITKHVDTGAQNEIR